MSYRSLVGAITLVSGLSIAASAAFAFDESKFPAWRGQWQKIGGIQWDPSKKLGRDEAPPLKPQYQALFEASLADQATGGQGLDPTFTCIPPGMPRAMTVVFPMEVIIMPDTTYIIIEYDNQVRRIYTDGRAWPKDAEPAFAGYSIGQWSDADANGRFNTLEVETRGFKGPRTFDASGIPLHEDNQTIVKERIYLDKADSDVLHDEVTTIDNALTHPWTVLKSYRRVGNPMWFDYNCPEGNHHVRVGKENYFVSEDGALWPSKKGQAPPQLKYFDQKKN
ncbi:MAG TPA: hypothetical protein VIY51_25730 [Xanthobacteraceae bacterium]